MFSASRMNLLRNFSGQHLVFAIAVLSIFVGYRCCCEAAFSEYEDIEFELHTRELPESYQRLNTSWGDHILGTQWKAGRPTRMFVHGFKSKRKTIDRYKNAFLASGDYNFIAVNWMKGSSTFNYYVAKNRVKKVARMLAGFIVYLTSYGMQLDELLIVGHSLGAHISGVAGKQLQNGRIGVIIGLDPAGPLFSLNKVTKRLADTDANYVQVIHTDGGHLSIKHPIGHADFFPNGGTEQPGCSLGNVITSYLKKCSHSKAHHYYLESLRPAQEFPAIKCISFEEIEDGQCTIIERRKTFLMGGDLTKEKERPVGIFYLETMDDPPYVISDVNRFDHIRIVDYAGAQS